MDDPDVTPFTRVLEQAIVETEKRESRKRRRSRKKQLRSHCDLERGFELVQGYVVGVSIPAVFLVCEENRGSEAGGENLEFDVSLVCCEWRV